MLGTFVVSDGVAQDISPTAQPPVSVSLRGVAMEANSPPGSCGCFFLVGGAADATLALTGHIGAVVDVAGETTRQVPGTARGLSTISLLAGPRYTVAPGRFHFGTQALFGTVRGFDADFRTGPDATDTQTAFSFSVGETADWMLRPSVGIRVMQAEFVQSNLANGQDNRQRNLRLSAGLVFHLSSVGARR